MVFVGLLSLAIALTALWLSLGVDPWLVSGLAVAIVAIVAAFSERHWPARSDSRQLDQPFAVDAAHFLLNYNLGYAIAMAGCYALAGVSVPLWPSEWPLAAQLVLVCFIAEGSSYWQHRLVHRVSWLWPFHALHHSGGSLNLVRGGRFHFVDISAGAFMVFAPAVLLGAPEEIITWLASFSGALGVAQHANIAGRTPAWLDRLVCTPAVHRHHHSIDEAESDANFGTVVMAFDILFGTYAQPSPDGPAAIGVAADPTPRAETSWTAGFLRQFIAPFFAARVASATHRSTVAPRQRILALLGLASLCCFAIHCAQHLQSGDLDKLLWLSSFGTLMLSIGCLLDDARLNAVAFVWLCVSCTLWSIDVARGAPLDSAVLTHAVSLAFAAVAVRTSGFPRHSVTRAIVGMALLLIVTRIAGDPSHNVNFVF